MDSIKNFINYKQKEIILLVKKLISIQSFSGQELMIADFIAKFIAEEEIKVIKQKHDQTNNVVVIIGKGEPTLIYNGHLDTVCPTAEMWKITKPLIPLEQDGKIFGLGSTDMKGALASLIFAAFYLKETDFQGKLILALTAKEEIDGSGTKAFLDYGVKKKIFTIQKTAALVAEATAMQMVSVGCRGSAFITIQVKGKGGHSANPDKTKNPIGKLAEIILDLPSFVADLGKNYQDEILPLPTATPTAFWSGVVSKGSEVLTTKKNSVPYLAEAIFDFRNTPRLTENNFEDFKKELNQFLKKFSADGFKITWDFTAKPGTGHKIDPNHDLIKLAKKTLEENLGRENIKIGFEQGSNDAAAFGNVGIPAVNKVGPGTIGVNHKADEYVEIKNILLATEFYIKFALNYFNHFGGKNVNPKN